MMSEITRGVIAMPYKMAMSTEISRTQYYHRANSLLKERDEIHKALHDLIRDLEMRSTFKLGDDRGVVDCGNGVYMRAKKALGELE